MEWGAATDRNSSHLRKDLYPEHEKKLLQASLKITLLMKAQHLGALTPLGIVRRNPQVPQSSRSDLSPREQLERQAEFHSSTQDEA